MDGSDAAALVRAADEALYQAKRAGGNRVLAHEPTYLGGDEAQMPPPIEENGDARERAAIDLIVADSDQLPESPGDKA